MADKWEDELSAEINRISNLISSAYQTAENEILLPFSMVDGFTVADLSAYPNVYSKVNEVIESLTTYAVMSIQNSVIKSWDLSNKKNDKLVNAYFKGFKGAETSQLKDRYLDENIPVRNAFLARKTNGLNLSERVWNYNQGYKTEIEEALQIGIGNGVSAKKMSKLLKDYLRNPSATILEVDEAGVANKLVGQTKTGQGVYKDPYKNALRLARTETNMAYRTADTTRWQQLDFVVGIEIHLSKNHTTKIHGKPVDLNDICDELQGKYPKDFKFSGWHPNCRCYMTSILKTEEEMERDEERMRKGKEPSPNSVNTVTGTPPQLSEWITDNTTRLEKSTSLPYFVRDNVSYFSGVDFPDAVKKQFAETKAMKKAQILQNAKLRHDARTPEQIADIKARWAAREKELHRQAILAKAAERHAARTQQEIDDIRQRWAERQQDIHKQQILKNAAIRHSQRTPEQIEDIKARWAERQKNNKRKATLAKAEARHAARTDEEIADIKARWAARQKENRRKATLAKAEARHAARTKAQIKDIQKRWAERQERMFAERLGTRYLAAAKEYQFDTKTLVKLEAIGKKNVKAINKAIEDIKAVKQSVKSMPHITMEDFKLFTPKELQSASTAIEAKLKSISTLPLSQQKSKLAFEITYPNNYKTAQIAVREYKAALAEVDYKLRIEEYLNKVSGYKSFPATTKNAAVSKAEKILQGGGKLTAAEEKEVQTLLAKAEQEKQSYISDFVSKNKYIKAADFDSFTVSELEQAQAAVESKIASFANLPLDQQKKKLDFEISWVQSHKKYNTWSISERAYKDELKLVEYKIRIEEYTDKLAKLKAFSTTDKTYATTLSKTESLLTKATLTPAEETTLKTLLSDLEAQKKALGGAPTLEQEIADKIQAAHGKYSKNIINSYGYSDWVAADPELQKLQRELKKQIEDEAYANYATTPATPPIKKVTKTSLTAAEKLWSNHKISPSYVMGSYGGTFYGGQNFYTGLTWDAVKADKAFAAKLNSFGVDVTWQELNYISTYCYKSGFINKYLNGVVTPTATERKMLDAYTKLLDNTLTKMPKYKGTTYRGACISKSNMANDGMWKDIMDSWDKGGVWESKAPMSSTANVDSASYFADGVTANHLASYDKQRVLFVVKGKTGVSVSDIAGDPKQDEVLFRSGTKFKITKKPYQVTDKNAAFGGVGDYIVELEEI